MASQGKTMALAAAGLLVVAILLALQMPLVAANLDLFTSAQLARWTFDGTLDDVDKGNYGWRGPAVPMGHPSKVSLAWDNDVPGEVGNGGYIRIRQPAYLTLPTMQLHERPGFTVTFSLRIESYPKTTQILYANWRRGTQQFLSTLDPAGKISVKLSRNMKANDTDPDQSLLDLDSADSVVPVGAWFDVAFQYDRATRSGRLFLDQNEVGSATVRASIADADVGLMGNGYYTNHFGRKVDTDKVGRLDADLRQFRVFGSAIVVEQS